MCVSDPTQVLASSTPIPQDEALGLWDDQVMAGINSLNKLRRTLALTLLTWAATMQDPSAFAYALVRSSAALSPGPSPGPSPDISAVPSLDASSLFSTSASTAAMKLEGVSTGLKSNQKNLRGLTLPIAPGLAGPISIPVVAELVASVRSGSVGSNGPPLLSPSVGGGVPSSHIGSGNHNILLEGSQAIMSYMAGERLLETVDEGIDDRGSGVGEDGKNPAEMPKVARTKSTRVPRGEGLQVLN